MKLTQRQIDDLLVMTEHVRRDISYGGGGSYNDGDKDGEYIFDSKSARKAERAIAFIRNLILNRD